MREENIQEFGNIQMTYIKGKNSEVESKIFTKLDEKWKDFDFYDYLSRNKVRKTSEIIWGLSSFLECTKMFSTKVLKIPHIIFIPIYF